MADINIKMKNGPTISLKTKGQPNSTSAIFLILRWGRGWCRALAQLFRVRGPEIKGRDDTSQGLGLLALAALSIAARCSRRRAAQVQPHKADVREAGHRLPRRLGQVGAGDESAVLGSATPAVLCGPSLGGGAVSLEQLRNV